VRYLGFHRVSVGVVGFNKNALRFWKSLGFKKDFCDNEYSDFIMMSILENEFITRTEKST
jgi:RimJ/RimL family protein N-acetyltransferase